MTTAKAVTRPSRPTIDAVMDNMPPYTGAIAKGGLTNDSRPSVSGRGTAGSIIHVLVDGREIGTAVVAANGTWSFAMSQSLRDGEYRLTARASNDAGMSVPSTSYGIQVDTTPPSQPKIEAATQGTAPQLSGRAEAYSTVTVYDGAKVLGTTTTGIDGTWTFQLPYGLSNGTHAMTVTAMDPAGNTSAASAGYDVVIGPVAPPIPPTPPTPQAQALLDSMGRDSGSFNFDRLTNDGTAGRLLSGHVSAALAAGEKVQVSTDGGRTWQDALTKSDGTWVVIDPNAHPGNWAIDTRVVNSQGIAGTQKSYDVTLDMTAPGAPESLMLDAAKGTVQVGIAKTGGAAGDTVKVILGDYTIDYKLTAQDIKSGSVTLAVPTSVKVALGAGWKAEMKVCAAVVDQAGNSSDWRWSKMEARKSFDVGDQPSGAFRKLVTDVATLEVAGIPGVPAAQSAASIGKNASGESTLGCMGRVNISLDGFSATGISMRVFGDQTGATSSNGYTRVEVGTAVIFYDAKGSVISTQYVPTMPNNIADVSFRMPAGKAFSSMSITTGYYSMLESTGQQEGGAMVWQWNQRPWIRTSNRFENIKFDLSPSDALSTGVEPVHDIQNVVLLSGFYTGGHGDDVFNVGDVRYFDGAEVGVHGGAGIDTLKLTGSGQVMDLSKLVNVGGTDKLSSIEIIDITGTGDNTLKLSMSDVLTLGQKDLFRNDGHTQMMVHGNAGDRIELSGMAGLDVGNWTNQGLAAIHGRAYVVYENATLNVELMVQSSVTTQLV
ncbi:Ig-like domain-containing protein [Burkholderia sp. MSMB1078WGS]|uniref:Ig-like domain-containing protein n=1 Tax=Burkholderia sp. MSMB1078WGS TaxID=1637900 RepID=UPI000ACCCFE1|nr:Ig-like domain-containing protein [Burkholderia sp. MSMB1078WGS]